MNDNGTISAFDDTGWRKLPELLLHNAEVMTASDSIHRFSARFLLHNYNEF